MSEQIITPICSSAQDLSHSKTRKSFLYFLFVEQDVDGETLQLMNDMDCIKSIFPKYKQQLLFLHHRKKLFDALIPIDVLNKENEKIASSTISEPSSDVSSDAKCVDSFVDTQESLLRDVPMQEISNVESSMFHIESTNSIALPNNYRIPSQDLPPSILIDINKGDLSKFNSHCKNRQILIDVLFHDLTRNYKLW